eukprot:TRINITY_DN1040_c0_g1_i1.p1 TRINITY_DN1040_c0_g1~~TRINITY_DN1040_c0_g1_i1.p1  ORF type:complete len:525 (-),score=62.18 TRINITY_DN1040_c0_g1_i1:113-1687(-)
MPVMPQTTRKRPRRESAPAGSCDLRITCPKWSGCLGRVVSEHSSNPALFGSVKIVAGDPPKHFDSPALIICGFSKPLRAMLLGGGVESSSRQIVLPEVPSEIWAVIHSWVHTGTIQMDGLNVLGSLKTAAIYDFATLAELLEDLITDELTTECVLSVLGTAQQLQTVPRLVETCLQFIDNYGTAFLGEDSNVPAEADAALLGLILERSSLQISGELLVYEAVLRWFDHHPMDLGGLERLLGLVRFGSMPVAELVNLEGVAHPYPIQVNRLLEARFNEAFRCLAMKAENSMLGSLSPAAQRRMVARDYPTHPLGTDQDHGVMWSIATDHGLNHWDDRRLDGKVRVRSTLQCVTPDCDCLNGSWSDACGWDCSPNGQRHEMAVGCECASPQFRGGPEQWVEWTLLDRVMHLTHFAYALGDCCPGEWTDWVFQGKHSAGGDWVVLNDTHNNEIAVWEEEPEFNPKLFAVVYPANALTSNPSSRRPGFFNQFRLLGFNAGSSCMHIRHMEFFGDCAHVRGNCAFQNPQ